MSGQTAAPPQPSPPATLTARAILLGERIDTAGLERRDAISTAPLALRVGDGLVVVFRYGVVVMVGLAPIAEDEVLRGILPRVHGALPQREEETVQLSAGEDREEGVGADGVVRIGDLSPARL